MQRTVDEAFSQALDAKSLVPIQGRLPAWARDIDIARRPALKRRYEHAQDVLATDDKGGHEDEEAVDQALAELSAVLDEALQEVRG